MQKKKNKKTKNKKKREQKESHTTFLVTCVGYHDKGYRPTMFGLYTIATYPSVGGRCMTRGMRVPRKEYTRSRHQRLFEENVGKTGKDAIYELVSERFGSCIYARGRY